MFPPANIDRELAKRGRPGVWAYGVIAALVVLAGTGAAPFLYTLF